VPVASLPPERRLQLVRGHQASVAGVRHRLATFAALTWHNLGAYHDPDIDRFVQLMVPRVLAGQRQVAGLTDAYVAALAGRPSLGVDPALVTGSAVRAGAEPEAVYRRPAIALYTALSKAVPFEQAVARGAVRLQSVLLTDIQLAKRQQLQLSMKSSGFQRYNRVLTGAENCELCVIASTNSYSTEDLLPIHNRCDCDVEPEGDGESVANSLNPDQGAVDAAAAATAGRGDVVVREHGEYGPVLTFAGDDFTGPGDLAA
jgi:hypothetical protein